jgi:hypothetical protein
MERTVQKKISKRNDSYNRSQTIHNKRLLDGIIQGCPCPSIVLLLHTYCAAMRYYSTPIGQL